MGPLQQRHVLPRSFDLLRARTVRRRLSSVGIAPLNHPLPLHNPLSNLPKALLFLISQCHLWAESHTAF